MRKLKSDIIELMDNLNDVWISKLKEAEESGEGVDLARVMGEYSNLMVKLDKQFNEMEERQQANKKKGKLW